jgi:autotransporter translocation and assembly factor TamB
MAPRMSRVGRDAGLVLAGLILGLALVLLGVYVYYRSVVEVQSTERLLHRLNLPPETLQLEELEGDSVARVLVHDLLIRGRGGDTIIYAPTARFRLDLTTISASRPTTLSQVELTDPYVNVVQSRNGEMNIAQVMAVSAGGQEILPEDRSAGFLLRDVTIRGGRVRIATPWVPDSLPIREGKRAEVRLARVGGVTMRIRGVRDLNARIPLLRFGGTTPWRADIAAMSARLTDPDLRLLALRGSVEATSAAGTAARFRVDELRTERSTLAASGTVSFGGEALQYQAQVRANPADFADLQWVVPSLPAGGQVRGLFAFATRPAGRIEVRGTDVLVTALDSRVSGRFSALVGGTEPATFRDTRLTLDPLRLETLDSLGFGERIPYNGEIRGTVATAGEGTATASSLDVDLTATFAPRDGSAPTSTVIARGPVAIGGEAGVRLGGVRVELSPLYLAALRPFAPPEQADRLQGTVTGSVVATGTMDEIRVDDGDLAYTVGDAPPSRLTGIELELSMGTPIRFDLQAQAQPLAIATVKELFPALPFESALFTGPIHISGTSDEIRLDAQLSGSPGSFTVGGTVRPGTPLRFDLAGRLSALSPDALLSRPVPVEGPLSGTFNAVGSLENFRFGVDFTQQGGRFALGGQVRMPAGASPIFEVAGNVTNFNLGALVGRPQLFPSPMTGRIELNGGGQQPYRFAANLRGESGAFDVRGGYAPGDIPTYYVSGSIAGLNLQQLPYATSLPATNLTGTIDLQGRGTSLETLSGTMRLNATGSTVAGIPMDALRASVAISAGVLTVDTLDARLSGAQLTARGTLGLTQPVSTPLQYSLVVPDLAAFTPLLPPNQATPTRLAGSLSLQGTLSGSVKAPIVQATFQGQDLRYGDWQAGRLAFQTQADLSNGLQGLTGRLELTGERLAMAGGTSLDSLRLNLQGRAGGEVSVRGAATRSEGTSVSLAGLVRLEGRTPRGLLMDSLMVRSGGATWQLASRAEIRWGGVDGVLINNFLFRRADGQPGSVFVNGVLPPKGTATLQVAVRNLDLDLIRGTIPAVPDVAGIIDLDATLQGPVTDPQFSMDGRVHAFAFRGVAVDSVVMSARYDQQRMIANASVWRGALRVATLDGTVPMRIVLENTIPSFSLLRDAPLTAHVVTDSLPLGFVAAANPQLQDVTGTISAEMSLTGTADRPVLLGGATLADGAVTIPQLGRRYTNITGRVSLADNVVRLDSLRVVSDGSALVNGTIRLADLSHPEFYLTANFDGFKAVQNRDLADLTVGGNVNLSGTLPSPVISGRVELQQGVVYIPTLNNRLPLDITGADIGDIGMDTLTAAALAPGFLAGVQVQNLQVVVNEGVWLQSDEARVEIRSSGEGLLIIKTGDMPRIYGELEAVRGTYALTVGPLVRDFDVVGGSVRFLGTPDLNPDLDITAQHEVRVSGTSTNNTLAILVHLTGTLEYPKITLTSNTRPPLPESELLNYLVFGGPTFQSAFAGQTSASVSGLANQGVQEFLGGLVAQELRHILPCQYFRLSGQQEIVSGVLSANPFGGLAGTTFECGVQIANNLFLTLETSPLITGSVGNQFAMSLEWQVNTHVTARLAYEPVRSALSTLILAPVTVPNQVSVEVRGTWEFLKPSTQGPPTPESPVPEPELPGTVTPPPPTPPPQP